jgi:hypothetical protein
MGTKAPRRSSARIEDAEKEKKIIPYRESKMRNARDTKPLQNFTGLLKCAEGSKKHKPKMTFLFSIRCPAGKT